ncbi:MAG: phage holin family protein [Rhodothermales bacterium]|nr:phage holin family protein [Rhodothermales bacterium]MCA0268965.1 phage holin family protein [Bacteroidota bacterium]
MSESLARTDPAALPGRDLPAPATGTGTTPLALPHAATRLDRIQAQTETLVESVKEWAELRIKLTQTELEQKAQLKINQMVWARAVPLLLISLAAMFLLITIALGLGWLLGHTFWGFLIVTVALMSSAGGVAYFNRATLRNLSEEADVDLSITSHV